jgi:hypothetical protein
MNLPAIDRQDTKASLAEATEDTTPKNSYCDSGAVAAGVGWWLGSPDIE